MKQRELTSTSPIDLAISLGHLRRGIHDPTMQLDRSGIWMAFNTPDGTALQRVVGTKSQFTVTSWGDGADWACQESDALLGLRDRPETFEPADPFVRGLHRRYSGFRFCATHRVVDAVVPSILEQKVQAVAAYRSYSQLVRRWGEPAPGPRKLFVPPSAEALARRAGWEMHEFNVERRRADTIRRACSHAHRLEEIVSMTPGKARRRLTVLSGIGDWTAAEVMAKALGDPDSVSVGDYRIPHIVAWNLAGKARSDDREMLDLLRPYAGQRGRVVRLLLLGGRRPPKLGPKLSIRDITRH